MTEPQNNDKRIGLSLADFDLIRRLGDGSFSHVVLAKHKTTGKNYALKVIDKHHIVRHNAVPRIQLERNLLTQFQYDGITTLHFTFQDAISLYIGLDYCPHGELYDQIRNQGPMEEATVQFYAAEMVLMLEYLRQHRVVHRDLKPENLLFTADNHLKLIDFGSAKVLPPSTSEEADDDQEKKKKTVKEDRAVSLVGTADYVSPEVLENKPLSYATDLWSLGCVIYQMLIGRAPFKAASEYLTFQKITDLDYAALPDTCSLELRDLVSKLLVLNPSERLGAEDIEELKAHEFFKGVDWSGIRSSPAPDIVIRDDDSIGSTTSSFDWELQSLVAALPRIASELKFRNSIEID